MPAARGVEVLMTILCWTVPAAEVANWVLVVVVEEMGVWVLLTADWEEATEEMVSTPTSLWIFEGWWT